MTWLKTSRILSCLFVALVLTATAVGSVRAGPRVLVLNESGKELRGELESIRNETVNLLAGSFPLKLSLDALKLIQFDNLDRPETVRDRSVLVLRNGKVQPFRRVLNSKGTQLTVQDSDGNRRSIPYGKLRSLHFGKSIQEHTIVYRNQNGGSMPIQYRPASSELRIGKRRWRVNKNQDLYECATISEQSEAGDTGTITLWKLPPEPGTRWSLGQSDGTGEWLRDGADTAIQERFSTRTFPFRFQIPAVSREISVRGHFSSELLLPVEFTVRNGKPRKWSLSEWPEAMTFESCFLYPIIVDHLSPNGVRTDTEGVRTRNRSRD